MLGCLGGALLSVLGGLVDIPIIQLSGAVICAAFCVQMIRMMAFKPNRS
jgi:NCAIR mutase (PurE)-related protein